MDVWQHSHNRCRGCAAKVNPHTLHKVLEELDLKQVGPFSGRDGVPLGQEDAAILPTAPAGMVTVQTVDVLNALVDDPYLFGRIAAVHALSDCFAMGAQPVTALAMVQVRSIFSSPVCVCTGTGSARHQLPTLDHRYPYSCALYACDFFCFNVSVCCLFVVRHGTVALA